jgi:hypothetical protein
MKREQIHIGQPGGAPHVSASERQHLARVLVKEPLQQLASSRASRSGTFIHTVGTLDTLGFWLGANGLKCPHLGTTADRADLRHRRNVNDGAAPLSRREGCGETEADKNEGR